MLLGICDLTFQTHYVWFMRKCNALRLDCFPLKVGEGIVTYKCGCVGVKAQWMVAVWEGQDRALFETGRIGADKKKQGALSKRSNTKLLLSEPRCSDRTMQVLCIILHLQNIQWARISFHKWVRQPLLWWILERSGKKTKNKHFRQIFNISSGETERHSRIQPVKPGLCRGCSYGWCCSLWKHFFHQPQCERANKDNGNYLSFKF